MSSSVLAAGLAPSAPANLQGEIVSGEARLTWDVPEDDDNVVGYNVYVDDRYAATVFTNSYTAAVEPGTLYVFNVVAFDEEPRQFSMSSQDLVLPESLIPDDTTVPPTAPAGLSGDVDGTQVSLNWEPSTDDEVVQGYNVYRDNQYETTVQATSYEASQEEGASHAWYVVAFDIRKNFSVRSERLVLPDPGIVDTSIAPSVPEALRGEALPGGTDTDGDTTVELPDIVELEWDASTDDQVVAGYNVYRNQQYIATRFETRFTGQVAAGTTNSFQVVAFDFDGNFSALSEAFILKSGVVIVDPGVPPTIPTGLEGDTVTADGQTTVTLNWRESTSTAPVAGYNVYRNNGYLTTVFNNAFTDTVPSGTAFVYRVVSFDSFGNFSPKSAPLNLLGDASQPPFFSDLSDQRLLAGELWELILRPIDLDGGAAGIVVSTLPAGMAFIDNFDGTRSLVWEPTTEDIGIYLITVAAFDLEDAELRTEQTITISVVAGDQGVAPFSLFVAADAYELQEGDLAGVSIPVELRRDDDFISQVSVRIDTESPADMDNLSTAVTPEVLETGDQQFTVSLQLSVGVRPIESQQRRFIITASDGTRDVSTAVTVAVTPVARDDVYLLIGQSNMVGFSEDFAKQAEAGGADTAELRIRQANVRPNDGKLYPTVESYTDTVADFLDPSYVLAEDPLHDPVDPDTLIKGGTRIGFGLSFAKAALPSTTRNIVLVPAAWAGSAFCGTAPAFANWNAQLTDNSALGNTLLFDRALARINATLADTGGILRGIIWHQGESDANADCAEFYEENLVNMVAELRNRIVEDARGPAARGPDAAVPFIAATMSRGADERGDLSLFPVEKQVVDNVHKNISSVIPHSAVVVNDDLVPANGFPCGEGSCIHFGAAALREMGVRSFNALHRVADQ
ncbi:MAG: sialate O-acetylesterase [Granulosicoccus sp.]